MHTRACALQAPDTIKQPPASSRYLPPELITLIFRLCLDHENYRLGCPVISGSSPPLTLTWVCRTWRALAMFMPELWTGLTLRSDYGSYAREEDAVLLDLFLSRAGDTLPLRIELIYGDTDEVTDEDFVPLFDAYTFTGRAQRESHLEGIRLLASILAPVRHRWCTLSIHSLLPQTLIPFLDALTDGAPQLEHLILSSQYPEQFPPDIDTHTPLELDIKRCPRLHTLSILAPDIALAPDPLEPQPFNPDLQQEPLTYPTLTTLTLGSSNSQPDAFEWLKACPNLTSLSLSFKDAPPLTFPFSRTITMPHLVHFSLSTTWPRSHPNAGLFLSLVRLPALESFSLSMGSEPAESDVPDAEPSGIHAFVGLLERLIRLSSPPTLKSLTLLGTPVPPAEILEILSLSPSLQNLTIDNLLATEDVLAALTSPPSRPPVPDPSLNLDDRAPGEVHQVEERLLCPVLESLHVHKYARSAAFLARMALSRCYHETSTCHSPEVSPVSISAVSASGYFQPQPLKKLVLTDCRDPSLLSYPAFSECRQRGLVLETYPQHPNIDTDMDVDIDTILGQIRL